MKDWGLSFQNKKSAKIFFQILKEGVPNSSNENTIHEDLLGKRDDLWSDDYDIPEPTQGKLLC